MPEMRLRDGAPPWTPLGELTVTANPGPLAGFGVGEVGLGMEG